ncbi:MAG: ABC transporter ATP-binding protein [Thermodesulfobacteriota bacterium]|jgi:branched-chain amino acid transport system ATP-binding protein
MSQKVLLVQSLQKSFGGLRAIDSLGFTVAEHQIKSVIGPNGAGKTTLFNLITGIVPPTAGTLEFKGKILNGLKPHEIACLGISRTFQNLELFGNMTVLENVMLGRHSRTAAGLFSTGLRLPGMRREEKEIEEKAYAELCFMGLEDKALGGAASLPLGQQKLLEIARALATEPRLLLLDEPASGLNIRETEKLAETILKIRERGITVIVVEHDMALVMEISDDVLVLNYGRKIAEGPPRDIQRNREVIAAYLGEEVNHA